MADIAIFRINYKSDFILTLDSDAGWMTPFCIKFWTGAQSQAYYAYYDGMTYTHCAPVEGEPTKLLVQFDDHHLPIGNLKFQIGYHFTVADFPTSVEDEVINQASVIIEVDDAPAQVMLDFTGETAPEIEFSLPAYANEAQRIANEEARIAAETQRISNEEARIVAEEARQQNEQQRISQEQQRISQEQQRVNAEAERVNEFAQLKTASEAATTAANNAATLANEKAQLAADKAALAQSAANLANAKAQLAADKAALAQAAATLANEKAALAQQKAEYAQSQGVYAKAQGDYAKEMGESVEPDHQRAESDHQRAENDHTASETATVAANQATTAANNAATAANNAAAAATQAKEDMERDVQTLIENTDALLGAEDVPQFDPDEPYPVGYYVMNDGLFYKFILPHTSGDPWNPQEVKQTNLFEEIDQMSKLDYEQVTIDIEDEQGQPIENVEVVVKVEGEQSGRNLTTDAQGRCTTNVQ